MVVTRTNRGAPPDDPAGELTSSSEDELEVVENLPGPSLTPALGGRTLPFPTGRRPTGPPSRRSRATGTTNRAPPRDTDEVPAPVIPTTRRDTVPAPPETGRRRLTLNRGDFSLSEDDRLSQPRGGWLPSHRVLSEVRRWEVSFSGRRGEDVEEFLALIDESCSLVPIREEDLLKSLSFCVKGAARTWYREARSTIPNWPAAKAAFRERFADPDYQIALREEISCRTQGESESVLVYLSCMSGLFSRLDPLWTERERVRYAHRNMLPSYRLVTPLQDHWTMKDLERSAARQEQILRSMETKRIPPKPEASLCPAYAYREPRPTQRFPRRSGLHQIQDQGAVIEEDASGDDAAPEVLTALLPPRRENPRVPARKPRGNPPPHTGRPAEPTPETPRGQLPISGFANATPPVTEGQNGPACFNCNKPGHRHRECPDPRRLFCYRCGYSGTSTARCPFCNRGNERGDA